MLRSLAEFLSFFRRRAGWRFPFSIVLQLLQVFAQGVGLLTIIPLLHVAGILGDNEMGGVLAWLTNLLDAWGLELNLLGVLGLFMF